MRQHVAKPARRWSPAAWDGPLAREVDADAATPEAHEKTIQDAIMPSRASCCADPRKCFSYDVKFREGNLNKGGGMAMYQFDGAPRAKESQRLRSASCQEAGKRRKRKEKTRKQGVKQVWSIEEDQGATNH